MLFLTTRRIVSDQLEELPSVQEVISANGAIKKVTKKQRVFAPEFLAPVVLSHAVTILAAPFLFSWSALIFCYLVTGLFAYSMGIFHHMKLSHESFKANIWVSRIGSLLGTLTWRGPMAAPIRYAAMHRVHHQYSDQEPDPHSPIHGKFHSLFGWFWFISPVFRSLDQYGPIAGKISNDPFLRFLDKHVNLIQAIWGVLAFLIGMTLPVAFEGSLDPINGIRFMVYGVFVKTILVIYLAGAVDLINHGVGYRNYETKDLSTNSRLMGIVHLGGAISWHNNHHAHPAYFYVKRKWWEFDAHYMTLRILESLGAVSNIKVKIDLDDCKNTKAH